MKNTASSKSFLPTDFKTSTRALIFVSFLCLMIIGGLLMWQYKLTHPQKLFSSPVKKKQSLVASNSTFPAIAPDDERLKDAIAATDLTKAKTMVDQTGAFVGTITNVRSSTANKKVVLDFAENRETAMRAFIKPANFDKFPPLETLIGKKVFVYGVFSPHEERVQVELTETRQLKIVGALN